MYDYEGVLITINVTLSKDYNNNKQFTIICWSVRAIITGHPLVVIIHRTILVRNCAGRKTETMDDKSGGEMQLFIKRAT